LPESEPKSIHELAPGVRVDEHGLRISFSRAGGPGGQNVNKLNTKAVLWLDLAAVQGMNERAKARLISQAGRRLTDAGEIQLWSATHRTQERNREEVMEKLRQMILRALVEPKPRRRTRPTASSRARRLDQKRRRSETKSGRRSGGEF
jgi:ribosome-associated protein